MDNKLICANACNKDKLICEGVECYFSCSHPCCRSTILNYYKCIECGNTNFNKENIFDIIKQTNNKNIINYRPYYNLIEQIPAEDVKYLIHKYYFSDDKAEQTAINYLLRCIDNTLEREIKKELLISYKKIEDIKQTTNYKEKLIKLTFQNIERMKFEDRLASEIKLNDIILSFHKGFNYAQVVKITKCYIFLHPIKYEILKFSRTSDGSSTTNFIIETNNINLNIERAPYKILMTQRSREIKFNVFKCTETNYIVDTNEYTSPD